MTMQTDCYNESLTYIPLYYSYASYCEPEDINKWDCKWCNYASTNFKTENVISTDYLQAFIGYDNDQNQIVISFRGTHNYHDWMKDLEYKQIAYPNVENAYVHRGFYNSYLAIRNQGLISSLQSLLTTYPDTKDILITGHSMGGALTELCALDIIDNEIINDNIDIEIYTFGCPRWANKELAEYFNNLDNIINNWRIVNKHDPVAIVPGQFLGSHGYHHTAKQILYTDYSNLEYIECDGSGEDPKCGYSLWDEDSNAHLWYLNIHESCEDEDESLVLLSSFGDDQITTTQQSDEQNNNVHFGITDAHW
eukprot:CAMPEP_0201569656 /NCGR_PEP_ID=MMETSP0190_2-20130828/11452_1 /ASSEMBLY_ACC=CAM_ASM_000263 /TAXON_ID=37353 /ORGANISM="Rosalina sp." /LENGTH=307 /DNA_ID=CAMNT_0047992229 /DNA_START=14 /DNA_END=934 /DNA_ORIENTATION=+